LSIGKRIIKVPTYKGVLPGIPKVTFYGYIPLFFPEEIIIEYRNTVNQNDHIKYVKIQEATTLINITARLIGPDRFFWKGLLVELKNRQAESDFLARALTGGLPVWTRIPFLTEISWESNCVIRTVRFIHTGKQNDIIMVFLTLEKLRGGLLEDVRTIVNFAQIIARAVGPGNEKLFDPGNPVFPLVAQEPANSFKLNTEDRDYTATFADSGLSYKIEFVIIADQILMRLRDVESGRLIKEMPAIEGITYNADPFVKEAGVKDYHIKIEFRTVNIIRVNGIQQDPNGIISWDDSELEIYAELSE
jgi:hypothetical protein